ncbi:4'-phosphopantetheinyl transferase family protein [Hydrogenophaga flava]|uniref:4'-phosphopantetheinyl transferase family protein n=1 Tax=Hydrogenophaga flava TaxID=65657 RepID=UPI00082501DC|nr:4'-phosphopantetheinyl transferase superfamily protein [Hydrogenophaga flava]
MDAAQCLQPPSEPLLLQPLRLQLARALGGGIGVACTGVDGDPNLLWPSERTAILKAVPSRQREYAAGRQAARTAMQQIGCAPEAIPSAPDRSPVWPDGLTGSIAHGGRVCVGVVGWRHEVHAVGIDIEEDRAMGPDLWPSLCTDEELALLDQLPPHERGRRVTRLFCAKEAFYKWQYPQTERLLDFLDVQVTFSADATGFVVRATSDGAPLPRCSRQGTLLARDGLVLAWLLGPAS